MIKASHLFRALSLIRSSPCHVPFSLLVVSSCFPTMHCYCFFPAHSSRRLESESRQHLPLRAREPSSRLFLRGVTPREWNKDNNRACLAARRGDCPRLIPGPDGPEGLETRLKLVVASSSSPPRCGSFHWLRRAAQRCGNRSLGRLGPRA